MLAAWASLSHRWMRPHRSARGRRVHGGGSLGRAPPFWGLPTDLLSGSAAAGGLALINAIGNLGGYVGPKVMGFMKTATGSYAGGLRLLAAAYVLGIVLVLSLRTPRSTAAAEPLVPADAE